jgi:protein-disulfide isomerase
MKDAVEKGPPPQAKAAPGGGPSPAPAAAGKPACDAPGGDCGCKGNEEDEGEVRVEEVRLGASPVLGPARAPVTIVIFTDFECPFCRRSEDTLRAVADQYGSRVRFVFKNQPLPMHPSARPAARAALAAGEQGKFWEYHDLLFSHQDALDPASLDRYAKDLGLDLDRFHKAMADARTDAAIDADVAEATRLGVMGTPTFFVNGRRVIGAQPLPKFQSRVELALAEDRR